MFTGNGIKIFTGEYASMAAGYMSAEARVSSQALVTRNSQRS